MRNCKTIYRNSQISNGPCEATEAAKLWKNDLSPLTKVPEPSSAIGYRFSTRVRVMLCWRSTYLSPTPLAQLTTACVLDASYLDKEGAFCLQDTPAAIRTQQCSVWRHSFKSLKGACLFRRILHTLILWKQFSFFPFANWVFFLVVWLLSSLLCWFEDRY